MTDASKLKRWERLSPSSLDSWEKCPRSWKAERIDGEPPPPTFATEAGTFGHLILEHLMALDPGERTIEAAKATAAALWPEWATEDAYRSLNLDPKGELAFKYAVWKGVAGYFGIEDPTAVHLGDGSARELALTAELGGAIVVGHVDRLDKAPLGDVIVDYKFGKAPAKRYQGPKLRQIRLYAAMLVANGHELARRGSLMYVSEGVRVSELLTEDKIDAAVADVATAWSEIGVAIRTDSFDPKPGPLCGWCPQVTSCHEGQREVRSRAARGRLKDSAPARRWLRL